MGPIGGGTGDELVVAEVGGRGGWGKKHGGGCGRWGDGGGLEGEHGLYLNLVLLLVEGDALVQGHGRARIGGHLPRPTCKRNPSYAIWTSSPLTTHTHSLSLSALFLFVCVCERVSNNLYLVSSSARRRRRRKQEEPTALNSSTPSPSPTPVNEWMNGMCTHSSIHIVKCPSCPPFPF